MFRIETFHFGDSPPNLGPKDQLKVSEKTPLMVHDNPIYTMWGPQDS